MKNRIDTLFQQKKSITSIYFTAGYPDLESTMPLLTALQTSGIDMVEVGMPYSDPLADGPTIQATSKVALNNGMSTTHLFEQLKDMRKTISIPVVLMGNLNPVLQYGVERFCADAATAGVDAVLLPDLPPELYVAHYKSIFDTHGLHCVFLVTPQTSAKRLSYLDETTGGFLYAVSAAGTTGSEGGFGEAHSIYFKHLANSKLKHPVVVGFGIHSKKELDRAQEHLSGGIVGSAFLRAITNQKDYCIAARQFVQQLKSTPAE